jgi:two-component system, OmpR family, response regulator
VSIITVMKILIVEDEHRIANALKVGLNDEKYVVDVVYTGIEGYDLASTNDYDLIILDIMLPGLSGTEICKKLRLNNIDTPIIMLTALGQVQDKVNGLEIGADDYLTKPFSFVELLARIKAISKRPRKLSSELLTIDGLTLNINSFIVARDGVEIKLTSKEFMVLKYFMQHPNQIITKDQIINRVWDYDADILPNTIEVYIKNIRNKIDVPFKNKRQLLSTVRGFGYKIS